MKLKANLHFHSREDTKDSPSYTLFEGIDEAARLGFEILAITCHDKFIDSKEHADYARSRGILLIPGVEKTLERRHVVVLNPEEDIKNVKNLKELREYKKRNPEIFILAPHPFFYGYYSLKEKLGEYIDIFDAIECSWFYSKLFNRNKRGRETAEKFNLPFLATSDTHILEIMDKSYAIIEAEEKTAEAVFRAIRSKNFLNVNPPKDFWREMVWPVGKRELKSIFKRT